MDDWVKKMAEKMGATIVPELPGAGRGVLGAAHAAHFYRMRMEELRRQKQPQTPEQPTSSAQPELQIPQPTAQDLQNVAGVRFRAAQAELKETREELRKVEMRVSYILGSLEYVTQQLEGVAAAIKAATAAEEGKRRQLEAAAENVQPRSGEAER